MKVLSLLICLLFSGILQAQEVKIAFQQQLPNSHPRYLTDSNGKSETLNLIEKEDWAKDVFEKLKKRTDLYANLTDAQPDCNVFVIFVSDLYGGKIQKQNKP